MILGLTIFFGIVGFLSGCYISYSACRYYDKIWHSPWDWVRYWRMFHQTGNKIQKWIFVINIASLIIAIGLCIIMTEGSSDDNPADHYASANNCRLERPAYIPPDEWTVIETNCDYFVRLLEAEDSLYAGKSLSAREVQALMPHSEAEFRTFLMLGLYPDNGYNPHLEKLAAQYAIADSLDMMEHVLMWSVWGDSWEYPWEVAIEIEQKHPEKFRRTIERIWDAGWIGSYEEYRNGYLEYVNFKDSN